MVKGSIWTSSLLIVLCVFIIMMLRQVTSFLTCTTTRTKSRTTRSLGAIADEFLPPFAPPSPFPYPRRIPVPGTDKMLKVCYTDYDSLVVVSKPPGLLSVEGASGCSENAVSAGENPSPFIISFTMLLLYSSSLCSSQCAKSSVSPTSLVQSCIDWTWKPLVC